MVRLAIVVLVGCTQSATEPTCSPVVTLDSNHPFDTRTWNYDHDGISICTRLDATAIMQPHYEVSDSIASTNRLEIRDLHNQPIAIGAIVTLGDTMYPAVHWDPAGGTIYDVLLVIQPPSNVISGGTTVTQDLSPR